MFDEASFEVQSFSEDHFLFEDVPPGPGNDDRVQQGFIVNVGRLLVR